MTGRGGPSGRKTDRTVAIVGLGLMGGSLARALRVEDPDVRILGVDPNSVTGTRALSEGTIDRFDPEGDTLVADADVVVYAAPLRATLAMMGEHASRIGSEALVTDLVSLKGPILNRARELGLGDRTVGAHPLCGSEASGFGASDPDLFRDARIYLCGDEGVPDDLVRRAVEFWRRSGGKTERIGADEHDRRMAWVSHLPQLVANALAGALHAAGYEPADLGPGARDMTRLAASSPAMWQDLLAVSAPVTGTGLTSVTRALNIVADLLARRDIDRIAEFMERTRDWRAEAGAAPSTSAAAAPPATPAPSSSPDSPEPA